MADQLAVCTREVENLRLQVLAVRQTSEEHKAQTSSRLREYDQIHEEYQSLRKRYHALQRDVASAQKLKRQHTEHAVLESDNRRIKEQLASCDSKLRKCRPPVEVPGPRNAAERGALPPGARSRAPDR